MKSVLLKLYPQFLIVFITLTSFSISAQLIVSSTASVTDGESGFYELEGAYGITTVVIDGKTYALVASSLDDGVQIMNISNPADPTAIASVTDGDDFDELDGAYAITTVVIGGKTYALVASYVDDGVQIMDISNPASPTATASLRNAGGFDRLNGAIAITTVEMGDKIYALVASYVDHGVQIMDISNPASPTATASVVDGDGFDRLNGAIAITTVVVDGETYALVASYFDHGVQIMDISDPASPKATTSVEDEIGGFNKLDGARGITTVVVDGKTYALVAAAGSDDGVQIMELQGQTASIKDFREQGVLIYPNPVTNTLHIQSPLASELTYQVYDLTGKALSTHHQSGQNHSIDVSGLAKGIYLLKATHNNNTTAMQFVKQ